MTDDVRLQVEISELVVLLNDRVITPEQLHRLNRLLDGNAAAIDFYLECVSVQLGLHNFVSSNFDVSNTSDDAAVLQEAIKLDMHDSAIRELIIETEAAERATQENLMRRKGQGGVLRPAPQPIWKQILKAAALIAIAAGIILLDRRLRQNEPEAVPMPVATLSSSVDAQWGNSSRSFGEGDMIYPGLLILDKGYVHLSYYNGAHVIIQAPAALDIRTEDELYLQQGRIAVDIQDGKKIFVVQTPSATVTDLGTEFGVHVDDKGETQSCVFEGKVELKSRSESVQAAAPPVRMLYAGHSAKVEASGNIIDQDYQSHQYVRVKEYRIKRKAVEDSGYYRWLAHSYELQRQPGLVAYYNFERDLDNENVLRNSAAATGGRLDGTLGDGVNEERKPQWAQGRWPEKGGLLFSGEKHQFVKLPKDALLAIGGDLSVCWWMMMNQGDSGLAGRRIVLSNGGAEIKEEQSGFSLNFYYSHGIENGCFRAFHEYGEDKDAKVLTQTPVPANRWLHVAMVRDAASLQYLIYLNGELLESHPYPHNYEYLGRDEETSFPAIGCDGGRQREYYDGILDEIAIFNRILTPDEIHTLYQSGRIE